jgi:hypothetical protein
MPVALYDPRVTPWQVRETSFPSTGIPADQMRFLLSYAILAPSGHNTQPWKFQVEGGGRSLVAYADYDRRLRIADPDDRELLMSIGAALANLRVAAARFGCQAIIEPISGAASPLARGRGGCEAVALVTLAPADAGHLQGLDAGLRELFPAILRRRTNRGAFASKPLLPEHLACLANLAGLSLPRRYIGVRLITEWGLQGRLGQMIAAGDRAQMGNPAFRDELAGWVRVNSAGHGDGVAGDGLGVPDLVSWGGSWFIRSLDLGQFQARRDERLAREAAALAFIYGPDDPAGYLAAGELHEYFLLTCTLLGLQYCYANQPNQVPALRAALREALSGVLPAGANPQLLLRLGYGPAPSRAMARRRVDDVLLTS